MKIASWNVNGLKSIIDSGFKDFVKTNEIDIVCIQETKITNEVKELEIEGYYKYFNYSIKGGYSGVAIYSRKEAENIIVGIESENEFGEIENIDNEARVLTIEYNDFFIVSVYVPCSQAGIHRQNFRLEFDEQFYEYIEKLNNIKNVIICGEYNECHNNIDICNLEKHKKVQLFSDEERASFNELLNLGFIDTYRYMHPQMRKYTFWTNDVSNRECSKIGWRLDYILVSEYLKKDIREANILTNVCGSDHCPIELVIKV